MLIPNSRLLRRAMRWNLVPVRLPSITQNSKLPRAVVTAGWDRILKIWKYRFLPKPCLHTKFCVGSYHELVEFCTKYIKDQQIFFNYIDIAYFYRIMVISMYRPCGHLQGGLSENKRASHVSESFHRIKKNIYIKSWKDKRGDRSDRKTRKKM